MYRMIKVALGIAFVIGVGIYLLLAMRSLKVDIPFFEFMHEETYSKSKNINIAIGIYTGKSPFHLYENDKILNPVLTAAAVTDIDARFVADPFMVFEGNNWYIFFEAMNKKSGHGDIGLASSADGFSWKYQKIILDEPFHLSYPHVFLTENGYYMIPETNEQEKIRLYKAVEFPFKWEFVAILMSGLQFTDPTIFKHGDIWWLFVETDPKGDGTLRLYHSDEIQGPWKEHPESPIVDGDENIARPGGRIILYNRNIFRVTQDDWPTYGNKLRIFQIDHLTAAEYVEHELCDIPIFGPKSLNAKARLPLWRSNGIHHMDAHRLDDGNWIACVDGLNKTTLHRQWVVKIPVPWTKKEIK